MLFFCNLLVHIVQLLSLEGGAQPNVVHFNYYNYMEICISVTCRV